MNFVAENSNKLRKLGLGGKIIWARSMFNTWADSIGYTSLSMKQGSLFCFVCLANISQIMALHFALLVFSECSQWVEVHWVGFIMFQSTVEKLLNIEKKITENSFKSKQKIYKRIWAFLVLLKSPWWAGFKEGDFKKNRLEVGEILIFK